ncbi:MAG: hypothetical protein KJP25_07330 [Gammaproteobacteria bacterium]|nr:hypothetical protein [Gammaproteobacteria bacterium]NNL11564.1 hypothetical protein [Pseudomonadales bacterium]NNM11748.1 hypothetical protein [Pseudomonadales bacterium]
MFWQPASAANQFVPEVLKENIAVQINGVVLPAVRWQDQRLRQVFEKDAGAALFYRGNLQGYASSQFRMLGVNGRWKGLMLYNGDIYSLSASGESPLVFVANRQAKAHFDGARKANKDGARCAAHAHTKNQEAAALRATKASAEKTPLPVSIDSATAMLRAQLDARPRGEFLHAAAANFVASPTCQNPIDGVCLLPEIEFAYDIAYQNLPGNGFTPLERALAEINELEMFFELAFNYRFSRLSITMLNQQQDALVGDSNNAGTLLDRLRVLRGNGQLGFIVNPRSIFHFVTGRNFDPTQNEGNVVGLAYVSQVCAGSGLNTGLTDAGDTDALQPTAVSLIMAHEIGHNLGAQHDDPATNGCDASGYIMSGNIGQAGSATSEFSSCSIQDINNEVGASMSSICFDFPVDVEIVASASNQTEPPAATAFATQFRVTRADGFLPVDEMRVEAMLETPLNGYFTSASIPGGSCSVAADTVSCTASDPPPSFDVVLGAYVEQGADAFTITAAAQSITNGTADLVAGNDTATVSYDRFGPPLPTAPAVQPPTSEPSPGSGGGGASGIFFVAWLALLSFRRVLLRVSHR